MGLPADIASPSCPAAVADALTARFDGRLDILVHNAARTGGCRVGEVSPAFGDGRLIATVYGCGALDHLVDPTRTSTEALLATMLYCSAETADIALLSVPGSRSKITNALYALSTALISERDPDRWRRIHGKRHL